MNKMKKFSDLTKSGKSRRICIMMKKKRDFTLECMYDYYNECHEEEVLDHMADYYKGYDNKLYHAYIVCDNLYNSVQLGTKS